MMDLFTSVVVLCRALTPVTPRRPNKLSEMCRHITLGVARKRRGGYTKMVTDCIRIRGG